jgi:hypothetical protein
MLLLSGTIPTTSFRRPISRSERSEGCSTISAANAPKTRKLGRRDRVATHDCWLAIFHHKPPSEIPQWPIVSCSFPRSSRFWLKQGLSGMCSPALGAGLHCTTPRSPTQEHGLGAADAALQVSFGLAPATRPLRLTLGDVPAPVAGFRHAVLGFLKRGGIRTLRSVYRPLVAGQSTARAARTAHAIQHGDARARSDTVSCRWERPRDASSRTWLRSSWGTQIRPQTEGTCGYLWQGGAP